MNRFNTKKCKHCNKATSVMAERVNAEWKFGSVRRGAFADESGNVVGYEYIIGDTSTMLVQCRGGCGNYKIARKVLGRVRNDIKCDGRCESATGHVCDCACGGKNHGRRHAA